MSQAWVERPIPIQEGGGRVEAPTMERVRHRVAAIEWWRAARYSGVSVLATLATQVLLVTAHALLGVGATTANIAAVALTSVPAYFANRHWVWELQGRSSWRGEVLPFWAFTIAGLGLSTLAVTVVATVTDSSAAVSVANIGAFGALWVAKFFVLDGVVFAPAKVAEELAVA